VGPKATDKCAVFEVHGEMVRRFPIISAQSGDEEKKVEGFRILPWRRKGRKKGTFRRDWAKHNPGELKAHLKSTLIHSYYKN